MWPNATKPGHQWFTVQPTSNAAAESNTTNDAVPIYESNDDTNESDVQLDDDEFYDESNDESHDESYDESYDEPDGYESNAESNVHESNIESSDKSYDEPYDDEHESKCSEYEPNESKKLNEQSV